ncbi:MAG: beta-ketoacyl-[acyl-carrier-protein] synthase family protein [bacterium]|nr:beta-ketoacyl-[acyl-carrier-protein] synthase family protein [bacterium]
MSDDVVISGMGIVSPIGCGEGPFWDSLQQGRSGAGPVRGLDTAALSRSIACQVRDPIDETGDLGRASHLAISAARQAVESAGITPHDLRDNRTAILIGTTMGETQFIEQRLDAPADEWLGPEHMRRICRAKPGAIARHVQDNLGCSGFAMDLYGACAAGNMAITAARRRLLDGDCDLALVGGADGFSQLAFIGFMRLRVMAAEVCRPFDQQRDGLLVGEGAGLFVLERASSAKARGATVRARVAGCATTCENYHPTRPEPDGDGLTRATLGALAQAGLDPGAIDYVCAHGTGTPQNDAIEVKVMERCFPAGVAFSSIKALTGHPMGAAAALETACCLLSLENQTLIPTWHLRDVLEPCSLEAVREAPRSATLRHAVNNSAGFGGYNSSIILSAA